ncbi:MAG: S9 family peptidase [Planctomycetes bacterium]|nr:S9 family peptidase [Planctomycetota bacterium]
MVVGAAVAGFTGPVRAELPPLIPREVLFGNPDKMSPKISPDGKRLGYIAPDQGVLNVWIRTVGKSDDRVVTKDRIRGIRSFFWAENNEQILYVQDKGGDENWHIYCVTLGTNEEKDLTPFDGVQARVTAAEPAFPNEILLAINNRNPQLHDVYRADLKTGKLTLEAQNDAGFINWVADQHFQVRGAMKIASTSSTSLEVRETKDSAWRTLATWDPQDALSSGPVAFTPDGKGMYIISSAGSNTSQLRELDLASGKEKVLASDDEADVEDVVVHPTKYTIQAVGFNKQRTTWKVLDPTIAEDFAALERVRAGDFGLINRDHADQTWLVYYNTDNGPVYYYAYDRKTKKADLLFSNRAALEKLQLANMKPVSIKARDGLVVNGYLTLPVGVPGKNLPLVLNVHGGPWARDSWGYDGEAQWLANRGYACLQVNYRGSTGYGKKFLNAANREWAGKMHDDLIDAVNWAIAEGIADPKRVAIYGGSYGGYATLVGLTFTPDVFCCGVDIVGPSNLITFMETIPPYWKPIESILWDRVGHPEKDAEFLKSRSPLFKVDQIKKPLLIAQGANDPRVKKAESQQIVEALKKAGKVVEYVEYPDEGHGFARPENRLDFYGRAEKFLATHVGGRFEETTSKSDDAKPKPGAN